MLTLALVAGFAPTTATQAAAAKGKVKSVKVTNVVDNTLVLKKGKSYKLKTKVAVTGKVSKKVTFKTSNKKVATVSQSGKVKAKKKGTAKITIKSKANKKKKTVVKVYVNIPVTKITLDKTTATVKVGEEVKVSASVTPAKAKIKTVKFASNDDAVATVAKDGTVKGVKAGKATITATAVGATGNKVKATCEITVTDAEGNTPATTTTQAKTTEATTTEATTTEAEPTTEKPPVKLSYEGYDVKNPAFVEEFDGEELDRNTWNVETHEPGWVNAELQEYVDSTDNIYVKDGKLNLEPIETVGADGKKSYTSGRVNTQNKETFKYGLFECVAKVPDSQGYLPAFWMMPNDESLYGQWPRCGEIDCMEVMGQEPDLVYGTIHYGNPHGMSQGTAKSTGKNFAEDFHKYSCEWEPGVIRWYIDDVLYHEETNWNTTTTNQGTVTYPAPFDQEFYIILNLAIGGSWVGYPDETTKYGKDALFQIDSVKVYQKEKYDDNIPAPEKVELNFKKADKDGNFITNPTFATAESLTDDVDWKFMTANAGEATAKIENNAINVATVKEGTEDYSVQLVQAGLPAKKYSKYQVTFDAVATADRNMNVAVKAPDRSYIAYLSADVPVTTTKQTFTYNFTMEEPDDANARLEFNMGKAGTEGLTISNVSYKEIGGLSEEALAEMAKKNVLADGNSVHNGKFQEGVGRLGDWEVNIDENVDAKVSVTPLIQEKGKVVENRRLHVACGEDVDDVDSVLVSQENIPYLKGSDYTFSVYAQGDEKSAGKTIVASLGDKKFEMELTAENTKYEFNINKEDMEKITAEDKLIFSLGVPGNVWIDDVMICENAIIKNGTFDANLAGYELYVDTSAAAEGGVDVLAKNKSCDINITDTGDQDWKIQLKQNNVKLEKGKWYKLQFKIKSDMKRSFSYAIQRDGSVHKNDAGGEDWTPYVQKNVALEESDEYTTIENVFKMSEPTDEGGIFNIALGGGSNKTEHIVSIDDISVVETEEPEKPATPEGANMFADDAWESSTDASAGIVSTCDAIDGGFEYKISGVTDTAAEWMSRITQSGLTLEQGAKYKLTFDITSTAARTIKYGFQNASYAYYGGEEKNLAAGEDTEVTYEFTVGAETNENIMFYLNLGKIDIYGENGLDHSIVPEGETTYTIKNLKLVEVLPEDPNMFAVDAWESSTDASAGIVSTCEAIDGGFEYKISGVTDTAAEWMSRITQSGLTLEQGAKYKLTFDITSTAARTIKYGFQNASYAYYGGEEKNLAAGEDTEVTYEFTVGAETNENIMFYLNLGKIDIYGENGLDHSIVPEGETTYTIKNLKLVKVPAEASAGAE